MTIRYDIPDAEYHGLNHSLSSTGARKLLPPFTPRDFQHWRNAPRVDTDAFDLGHVVHALVLGRGAEYAVLDPAVHGLKKDGTVADNPRATATWKEAVSQARADGLTPIHVSDFRTADAMAAAVRADAAGYFVDGDPEVTVFATDPDTGVELRARFDWLKPGAIEDLKTARSAEPRHFERHAEDLGYVVQEAFYRHVAFLAGLEVQRFTFVAVAKQEPYHVTVHEYDDDALTVGAEMVRRAIDTFAECSRTDHWPGFPAEVNRMRLWRNRPSYAADAAALIAELENIA
ncbi:PD-(D/E)XK nuclease-like domain-containing protein [Micrococcus luteus]|uniref:PD-(D/E)XK nuclease-like domain-containing protein n=1 Tax=Micrococcus luteus TaxID=1270 RepID=UPI00344270F0